MPAMSFPARKVRMVCLFQQPAENGEYFGEENDQANSNKLAGNVLEHAGVDVGELPVWKRTLDEIGRKGDRR